MWSKADWRAYDKRRNKTPKRIAWRVAHRDQTRARKMINWAKSREHINRAKSSPCTDCGIQYNPWVMQFDHISGVKFRDVSQMIACSGLEKIKEEIAKCEVVCANCHANRTHNRREEKLQFSKKVIVSERAAQNVL
jgi:hypothetical protein